MQLYKYVGASYLSKVFSMEGLVVLRCSRPETFNDPYELFLTVDFRDSPEALAFYADVVGRIPQRPTTCFSRSPIVMPMWAHYAEDLSGVVIELDQSALRSAFPKSGFGDIDYKEGADPDLNRLLSIALLTKKPRHTFLLRRAVASAAYYTKTQLWSYEQETRMVVPESELREVNQLLLIDVPAACVSTLICGPRASEETRSAVRAKAEQLGSRFLEMKVGRTSPRPHFVDLLGDTYAWSEEGILQVEASCASCGEPINDEVEECSWCRITEAHSTEAAQSNPFRVLHRFGLLDGYVDSMNKIADGFHE